MQISKKTQAFTLSEMIVVLILTSIVVGLAFSVLDLVQKQILAIKDNYNKNLELTKLETALWLDFNRYPNITYHGFKEELVFKNELDSITYFFSEAYIIKGQDTFAIQLHQKQYYFDGKILNNGQVDALKLEASKAFQNKQLFVFKQNDATSYID
ncbi:hypothetical protein DIS18_05430 [Algibacter marinivivus]|uniref:Prepilin-type N-terminal cleavage/methylation domain-containing protein n=1 Tax=Algibacter marinivivus TaxID=2100723 RepID=A0A2U2X8C0_9FLAO|nr:prepilin-type N-terminal cleavage/methylation domain-containing protein [Algibacter marinivivus]PWH83990.1 hypothetical protein DIS18_05430 [Algibacter marinivivus]